jgi:copper oxidase (laccase) domain-containing protein
MSAAPYLAFPELNLPGVQHIFTLRSSLSAEPLTCRDALLAADFPCDYLVQAEQPHGSGIAHVTMEHAGCTIPHVDGLITNELGLTLAIRTADCGPLLLVDPVQCAIGLVHSGKKGTQAGILSAAITSMTTAFQSDPSTLIIVLAPCIRPPHYDLDFAGEIREQAHTSGVQHYYDSALNTGADLARFYSYRVEQGKTGRHYTALRLS